MSSQPLYKRILELFTDISRAVDRSISIFTRRTSIRRNTPTYSWGRADYDFWERAYYGKVEGLEISGLFIRPIVNKIASWVLGRPPSFQLKGKRGLAELEKWWDSYHSEILKAYRSSLKKGDSFIVINPDLSITLIPPNTVDPIVDPDNFSKQIGWRITQVFPNPDNTSQKMTVIEEFYADRRERTVQFSDGRNSKEIFPNLIGIIPIIHIGNQPSDGEKFGHPEAESLIEAFHRYGQILEASVEGNILQGRPTPVLSFATVQDLNAFWRRYGTRETHTKADGTIQEFDSLSIDMSELLTVSGASFSYQSPGSFAEDTERLLGLFFYLILEHIELPEFVFGNAIQGSKASAETQMPVLEVFIAMRQRECAVWILEIAKVVQAYLSLVRVGIRQEVPVLQWAKLTQNGRLVLDAVKWAYSEGLLDERTALVLLPLDVENPQEVLKQALKDAEIRHQREMELQLELQERQAQIASANSTTPTQEMNPDPLMDVYGELEEGSSQNGEIIYAKFN